MIIWIRDWHRQGCILICVSIVSHDCLDISLARAMLCVDFVFILPYVCLDMSLVSARLYFDLGLMVVALLFGY